MRYLIAIWVWLWAMILGASVRNVTLFLKTPRWAIMKKEIEGSKGDGLRFKQKVRDGRGLKLKTPRWLDYQVDEWYGPDGAGWEMRVHTKKGIIVVSSSEAISTEEN
jgi:hypothetical protein